MEKDLALLQERLRYQFHNLSLLSTAITHSSFANERTIHPVEDYERLEFLGDAVLEVCSSEYLYKKYTGKQEGWLTRRRASLVNEKALALCARKLELQEFIRFGKGERETGKAKDSIVADVSEAIIGAIYLDGGFEEAKSFVSWFVLAHEEEHVTFVDAKTILQETIQGHFQQDISYRLVSQFGPDHRKTFVMQVLLGEEVLGEGEGHSKKDAEQEAARQAILRIREKYPKITIVI
ncbi:MAG: ribonuclease III [Lachnospiraceae bacterium]|nr:ribonuclease III [Lachnospiraceae bacterium]